MDTRIVEFKRELRDLLSENIKGLQDKMSYIFGFESLKALFNWFDDPLGMYALDNLNIARIGVYSAPDEHVKLGSNQLMAKADQCLLIGTESLIQSSSIANVPLKAH